MKNALDEQGLALQSEAQAPITEPHLVKAVITFHGFNVAEFGQSFHRGELFENEDFNFFTMWRGERCEFFEEAFLEPDVYSGFSSES